MTSLFVGMAFALVACGPMNHGANDPNNGSGENQEVVCHDEKDTGSLMSHRVCQPRNHTTSDDDKKDTEQLLGKPRQAPTTNH